MDQQPQDSKTVFIVAVIAIIVFFAVVAGWVWSLRYSLQVPEPTAEEIEQQAEWDELRSDLDETLSDIRQRFDDLQEQQTADEADAPQFSQEAIDLITEQLSSVDTSDWSTYSNFDHGFTLKYPADWQQDSGSDGVTFTNPQTDEQVAIAVAAEIPQPAVDPSLIRPVFLDTLLVRRYVDQNQQDDTPLDVVIGTLPSGTMIQLAGYGEMFDAMLYSFSFVDTVN